MRFYRESKLEEQLSTYCRLKANSLRLTTERVGRGHDRLVAQPTGRGSAPTSTVLGRNVTSRIQVGIEMKSTLPTDEYALRTAVGAGRMPTAATSLRGMSRIDRDHRTTPFLGLVLDFAFETGERPAMHAAFGLPLFARTLALLCPLLACRCLLVRLPCFARLRMS
jgi:hypothetical protein